MKDVLKVNDFRKVFVDNEIAMNLDKSKNKIKSIVLRTNFKTKNIYFMVFCGEKKIDTFTDLQSALNLYNSL